MATKRKRAEKIQLDTRPPKKRATEVAVEEKDTTDNAAADSNGKAKQRTKTTNTKRTRQTKKPPTKTANRKTQQKRAKKLDAIDTDTIVKESSEKSAPDPLYPVRPGTVLVFGQGDCGQLGLGESMTERKKPFIVKIDDKDIVQVECGGMHTLALSTDGKLFSWGCNDEGALGYNIEDSESFKPLQVKALDEYKVVQVSAGDCHSAALLDNGDVYWWGIFRDSNGPFTIPGSTPSFEPKLVYEDKANGAVKLVSGDNHVMILTGAGDVFTFGSGDQGQLGRLPEIYRNRGGRLQLAAFITPDKIRIAKQRKSINPTFVDIYAGSYSSFAVAKESKSVYVWGLNNYHQLGLHVDDQEAIFFPLKVPGDWLWSWASTSTKQSPICMSGAIHHSLICASGKVYSVGNDNYGRLGLGKAPGETKIFKQVTAGIENEEIVSVECNGCCSFAVAESGTAYSWGMGSTLQLGQSNDDDLWEPTKITGKNLEERKVLSISCGGQHTAILATKSDV